MKGLYICKTYWGRSNRIFPVLKFGMTSNIKKRMEYFNKNSTYKLLAFFECEDIEIRERYFMEYSSFKNYMRASNCKNEHIEYEKYLFKSMYRELKEISEIKIAKKKNKFGIYNYSFIN
jgi:hypothetical protein